MTIDLSLECQGVNHGFGLKRVLFDVNLKVRRGQFLGLVGPSGCGKSTLLRAIIGTHMPRQGRILVHRRGASGYSHIAVVSGPGRDRGIVYQHYSLFPFLTALENVAIGPMLDETGLSFRCFKFFKWRKLRKTHTEMATAFLNKVKLGDALDLYPHEMSGGMRQRVAIAQAMIMKPEIILLDEPFGALDEATRQDLQKMLLTLYAENVQATRRGEFPPYTLIIVTHELNEALYVGDRVAGLTQYWDWKGEGHTQFPGATVVYDKAAPVFGPDEPYDFIGLAPQHDEIRKVVFDPTICLGRNECVTYWQGPGANPSPAS